MVYYLRLAAHLVLQWALPTGKVPLQSHGVAIVKYFSYSHADITLIYFVSTGRLDYYFRLAAHLVLQRALPAAGVANRPLQNMIYSEYINLIIW